MKRPESAALAVARALYCLHNGVVIPDYEPLLRQCYTRFLKPGHIVFDVGSHTGLHFAHFVELVGPTGRVIGFEPIPSLAAALRKEFQSKPYAEIRTLALADSPGRREFFYLVNAPGQSGLKFRTGVHDSGTTRIQVETDTLDRQAASVGHIDYIKIDVEGGEIDCLRGGATTIGQYRPLISVEYGEPTYSLFGQSDISLFEWAASNAYVPSDLFGNIIPTAEEWVAICDLSYWDYFLVPSEKVNWWEELFE